MCRVLKVSPSGYYSWLRCPVSARDKANTELLDEIKRVHYASKEAYGTLKIWKSLQEQGVPCGKHRIARLKRINDLLTKRRRRFKVTTRTRLTQPAAPNRLNRCFEIEQINRVWVGDVTCVATQSGWLYLAVLLDLCSRKVVGWSMSKRIDKALALNALAMATVNKTPPPGLMHHTDRGAIYTSDEYQGRLRKHQMTPSMSRKGDCYDNAVAESFFGTLKNELIYGNKYRSRDEARSAIFEYIELFYNRERLHQTLGYKTPEQFETEKSLI